MNNESWIGFDQQSNCYCFCLSGIWDLLMLLTITKYRTWQTDSYFFIESSVGVMQMSAWQGWWGMYMCNVWSSLDICTLSATTASLGSGTEHASVHWEMVETWYSFTLRSLVWHRVGHFSKSLGKMIEMRRKEMYFKISILQGCACDKEIKLKVILMSFLMIQIH